MICNLICISGVTRDPGGGLWPTMTPELGLDDADGKAGWLADEAPSVTASLETGINEATPANCNPAFEIFSFTSPIGWPRKFGIRKDGIAGGWDTRMLTFGETASAEFGAGD